jgi:hypothetical protein
MRIPPGASVAPTGPWFKLTRRSMSHIVTPAEAGVQSSSTALALGRPVRSLFAIEPEGANCEEQLAGSSAFAGMTIQI